MAKIQISDDEYSDDNEVLTDLMETEVSSAAHTPFAHPMYFIWYPFIVRVLYRSTQLGSIKSDKILFRQKLPIASWLSILEKKNTQYIHNGSFINPTRFATWQSQSAEEQQAEVELFLIHWKSLSYLHCSWESYDDMMKQFGPYIKQRFQVPSSRPHSLAFLPFWERDSFRNDGVWRGWLLQSRFHWNRPHFGCARDSGRSHLAVTFDPYRRNSGSDSRGRCREVRSIYQRILD